MTRERVLKGAGAWKRLAGRLDQVPSVTKHDCEDERESWTLVHDLADLEESFGRFLDEHLPKLAADDLTAEEAEKILLEIGEELRHVLYHIRNSRFYSYLDPAGSKAQRNQG